MTPEETILERLTAELSNARYDGKTNGQAWTMIHATSVTETVICLKTLTLQGLLGGLSSGSKARLRNWVDAQDLKAKILAQDRLGVGIYVDLLVSGDALTPALIEQEEASAVMAELAATETVEVTTQTDPAIWAIVCGIPGGPNDVTEEQFAAAWAAAGRN